jgi:uncharacterized protein (TIGR02996 family)
MAVYIVYRSHYSPACKQVKRFDDATVLDWFRNHWDRLTGADDPYRELAELLGFEVYGFGSLFEHAAEHGLPPPKSNKQLERYLDEHLYSEGPILCRPHVLTVQTDDDDLQVAYYIFDEVYLGRYPARAASLVHEDWRLPGGYADSGSFEPAEPTDDRGPHGTGAGDTYVVLECYLDSCNYEEMGMASRIRGIRLPELCRYLARTMSREDRSGNNWGGYDWSGYLSLLRSLLFATPVTADAAEEGFRRALLAAPDDGATWAAYSDWLQEMGERPAGLAFLERGLQAVTRYPVMDLPDESWEAVASGSVTDARKALQKVLAGKSPRDRREGASKSRVQVDEHVATLCLHVDTWGGIDVYHRWIFFDDLWAAAHPDLANSLLRYDRCWDVLTPGGPHDEDD